MVRFHIWKNTLRQKKAIYMHYKEELKDLPVQMNPYDEKNSEPNFWLSCLLIDKDAMDDGGRLGQGLGIDDLPFVIRSIVSLVIFWKIAEGGGQQRQGTGLRKILGFSLR